MGGSSSSGSSTPTYTPPTGYVSGPIYSQSAGQYPVKQFSMSLGGVPSYQQQMIQRPQIMPMNGYTGLNGLNAGYDAFKAYQQQYDAEQQAAYEAQIPMLSFYKNFGMLY